MSVAVLKPILLLLVVAGSVCIFSVSNADHNLTRVQIGYCSKISEIEAAKAAGFDYVELSTTEIANLSDSDFDKLIALLKRLNLPVPVTYLFIPATIKITGPKVDKEAQMVYVKKALDRVERLGVDTVILGSGPARQVPDGFPLKEGFQQLVEFCKRIGPEARAKNITIAIEAQRKQECNLINNLTEGLELIRAVNDKNIQLMVDFYQLSEEKEDPTVISRLSLDVRHLHMANPQGRVFPLTASEYEYEPFFATLKKIDYHRRISIEAKTADFNKEAPLAIKFLREYFNN